MNKKMSRRQRDIKTKLMAAICMLLVSSIMMVSTTYAWFTLSTAPEVTGIQTAVGANGNLEMALMSPALQNDDGSLLDNWGELITSGEEDSMDAAGQLIKEANITWGNLVDVSDNKTYGLGNITLYPSQMTYNGAGHDELHANPLARPVYGADGRVAELKNDTLTASYVSGLFSNEGKFGVRAVGTASSMTAREMAHRTALTNATNATTEAKGYASGTLNTNGNVLAGMAITHVGDESAKFTYAEVDTLRTVVKDLQKAHLKIEEALKWYVIAHNIAPESVTEAQATTIQATLEGMTLAQIAASTEYTRPAGFDDTTNAESETVLGAYSTLLASQEKVTSALGTLDTLLNADGATSRTDITWSEFSSALNVIMNYDKMLLCDLPMSEVKKQENGEYVNAGKIMEAYADGGLRLQMRPGSGVFADVADFCGTYTAEITFPDGTKVMGVNIGGWKARMTTDDPRTPTWLNGIRSVTNDFASAESGDESKSITDFYGYIIDLAFRTNASGSSLLLQAEGIDRIYGEDGKNEATMGGGSTMTFTATDSFGVTKVSSLMNSIRIVFFNPGTREIIAYAKLNTAKPADIEGNNVTMEIALCDMTGVLTNTNVITSLTQNEAKAVSVLVYLDGTNIKNADVAATGTQSMIGTMNLQFASSAELKPMDYADLKDGKSSTEGSTTIDLTAVTAPQGYTVTKAIGGSFSGVKGFGIVLDKDLSDGETITATVAGETVTGIPAVVNGQSGYAFPYSGTLAADTAITLTIGEAAQLPTTYTVTINGEPAAAATGGQEYTFTIPDGYTLTTVEVGGTDITTSVTDNKIPAAYVTGNIVITTTETQQEPGV